jgi:hypothetical protein
MIQIVPRFSNKYSPVLTWINHMDPVTTTPTIKAIRAMTAAISVDTFPCVTEVDLVSGTGVCCTLGDLVASPLNGDTGRPTGAMGGTAESEEEIQVLLEFSRF